MSSAASPTQNAYERVAAPGMSTSSAPAGGLAAKRPGGDGTGG